MRRGRALRCESADQRSCVESDEGACSIANRRCAHATAHVRIESIFCELRRGRRRASAGTWRKSPNAASPEDLCEESGGTWSGAQWGAWPELLRAYADEEGGSATATRGLEARGSTGVGARRSCGGHSYASKPRPKIWKGLALRGQSRTMMPPEGFALAVSSCCPRLEIEEERLGGCATRSKEGRARYGDFPNETLCSPKVLDVLLLHTICATASETLLPGVLNHEVSRSPSRRSSGTGRSVALGLGEPNRQGELEVKCEQREGLRQDILPLAEMETLICGLESHDTSDAKLSAAKRMCTMSRDRGLMPARNNLELNIQTPIYHSSDSNKYLFEPGVKLRDAGSERNQGHQWALQFEVESPDAASPEDLCNQGIKDRIVAEATKQEEVLRCTGQNDAWGESRHRALTVRGRGIRKSRKKKRKGSALAESGQEQLFGV
ncbi:hypothetical protein B0H17DRAFT_1129403 [Mycena rosella]|uniref:Uncharacterized protein n=1 Tax=Mycena rosella TaxID=1033263 RepID=A0AAD7DUM9_MYCRO|nr:hypothetical protein B0H17DRAFT_1129403 [Mycena rosella]